MKYKMIDGLISRINRNGYSQLSSRGILTALNRHEKEMKSTLDRLQDAHKEIDKFKEKIKKAKSYMDISYSRESDFHNNVLNEITSILDGE